MSILLQLGANYTAFIQFGLFILAITFLTVYVFNPYFAAFDKRIEQTKGGEDLAAEYTKKTLDLKVQYEGEARALNNQIKEIYDQQKKIAQEVADKEISSARAEATKIIDSGRKSLAEVGQKTSQELKSQAGEIAKLISKKLIG